MDKIVYVKVDAILLNYTDKAALLQIEKDEHWIPRAAISYQSDRLVNDDNLGEMLEFQIARWKAEQEGLL